MTRSDTLTYVLLPTATSGPNSRRVAWRSNRSMTRWCSRRVSMCGWTACSGCSNNTRYTHIDPAQRRDELTSLVEPADGEPFVLHPGSSSWVRRWRYARCPTIWPAGSKASRRWVGFGLLTHSTAGFIDPGFSGHITLNCPMWQICRSPCGRDEDRSALSAAAHQPRRTSVRQHRRRLEVSGSAGPTPPRPTSTSSRRLNPRATRSSTCSYSSPASMNGGYASVSSSATAPCTRPDLRCEVEGVAGAIEPTPWP